MKRADEKASTAAEAAARPASAETHAPKAEPGASKESDELRGRVQALESERERLRTENGQLQDRNLRLRADYDNLVKRSAKESQDAVRNVRGSILLRVASLVETLEALSADAEKKLGADSKGFKMVLDEARRLLKDEGLKEIPARGHTFNYRLHQAVEQVETTEHKEGTIVDVVHRGYLLGDDVLRHALVKVAAPPKQKTA